MNECNIVRDLLPLYADDLASEDSVEFIERHAANCPRCSEIWRRYQGELPQMEVTENMVENYQKGLRKDKWKMALLTLGCWLLVAVLAMGVYFYCGWEKGDFAEGTLYSSPDGIRGVKLVSLDGTGFFANEGSLVKFYFDRGYVNRYEVDWQDLTVHWAPDSQTMLLKIQNAGGETELRIVDHKGHVNGGTFDIPGLIPSEEEPDLAQLLKDLCAQQGIAASGFEFKKWAEDSETLIFCYYTDQQDSGFLSYHYPSGEITELYE